MDETEALAVRLLKNLQVVLTSEIPLSEYDFLPTLTSSRNKNPIVVESDKLGLEQWSLKIIYTYVHQYFHKLVSGIPKCVDDKGDFQGVFITQVLLMLNPEHMTAWNYRKLLLKSGTLLLKDDLKLMDLIMAKFPKSPETFAHRKWVVKLLIDNIKVSSLCHTETTDDTEVKTVLDHEFHICTLTASKYPNNYNAWSHRIWLFKSYIVGTRLLEHYIATEQSAISTFVSEHISDYSGLHYKQFLLKMASDDQHVSIVENYFQLEFQENFDLLSRYPDHEALWCHRRSLLFIYVEFTRSRESNRPASVVKKCKLDVQAKSADKKAIVSMDIEVLLQTESSTFKNFERCKEMWEKTLKQRYLQWIQKIPTLLL